jgi:hypothetical protein
MGERVGVCPARRRAETAEQEGCRHLGRGGGGGGGWIVIFLRAVGSGKPTSAETRGFYSGFKVTSAQGPPLERLVLGFF